MSNIYIQEPPTSGKVVLKTSFGDIEIELWSREAPKACRNFVQLCIEGYYDGVLFHRIVKGFIAQGGDPTGTGAGGESIYGHPFKDEIHSRLRFNRRGLVAMANAGKDDNGSQFFFTLGSTPELQSKHTIFGKVAGDTIFNLTKLNETLVDTEDKPVYDQKILKTIVLNNPFPDIVPRVEKKSEKVEKLSKKKDVVGVKEEIRKEINQIKTQLSKKKKDKKKDRDTDNTPSIPLLPPIDPLKHQYLENIKMYSSKKSEIPKKGSNREEFALSLLEQFKNKLHNAIQSSQDKSEKLSETEDDDDWKSHPLQFQKEDAVLAKDANKKDDDWFEIYDPRSAINKRKRESNKLNSKTDKDKKTKL